MRLGRVEFSVSYVVDLDNHDMVDHATDALFDDIWQMGKENDIERVIRVREADPSDTADDIPDFLHTTEEA